MTLRSHPEPKVRGGSWKEPPMPKARAHSREEQPHVQGAVAVWVQEGLEELFHVQGQEGGAAVKRYPSSKERSSGCTLLEP